MERRHFLVSGRVQGVSFRTFVLSAARSLGLVGATRNLDDGRVEILAVGEKSALAELELRVKRGPERARVDAVAVSTETQLKGASPDWLGGAGDFQIIEDGEKPWH